MISRCQIGGAMKKRRFQFGCLLAACAFGVGLLLASLAWWFFGVGGNARKGWKEGAIPEITQFANDKAWVSKEVALLMNPEMSSGSMIIAPGWLSKRMILMGSGEWLVYKSHCNKAPPHNVRDIFLAKGSNGKWYYSTCHFCIGMLALCMMQGELKDERPPDLAFFVKRYQLREFDGSSDECLKETKTFPDNQ